MYYRPARTMPSAASARLIRSESTRRGSDTISAPTNTTACRPRRAPILSRRAHSRSCLRIRFRTVLRFATAFDTTKKIRPGSSGDRPSTNRPSAVGTRRPLASTSRTRTRAGRGRTTIFVTQRDERVLSDDGAPTRAARSPHADARGSRVLGLVYVAWVDRFVSCTTAKNMYGNRSSIPHDAFKI